MITALDAVPVLRVARHCREPFALAAQYVAGLGFHEIGRFNDHAGFDGVMIGLHSATWHLEFVAGPHPRTAVPAQEDALVLYLPNQLAWRWACAAATDAGFAVVPAANPYWRDHGASFADSEGFRLILARQAWPA